MAEEIQERGSRGGIDGEAAQIVGVGRPGAGAPRRPARDAQGEGIGELHEVRALARCDEKIVLQRGRIIRGHVAQPAISIPHRLVHVRDEIHRGRLVGERPDADERRASKHGGRGVVRGVHVQPDGIPAGAQGEGLGRRLGLADDGAQGQPERRRREQQQSAENAGTAVLIFNEVIHKELLRV